MEQILLPNFRVTNKKFNDNSKLEIPRNLILNLIEAGIHAPSADNMQPWKFKILANGLELWRPEKNKHHFFDHQNIATDYSCGAVIENIVTYSKSLNLETKVSFDIGNSNKIVEILLYHDNKNQVDGFSKAIFDRGTDRNLYDSQRKIPPMIINNLKANIESIGSYQLHDYFEKKMRDEIISIITKVDAFRFSHKKIHHDFYEILRFGKSASEFKDGLADSTLGIESILVSPLKLLKSWSLTKVLNYFGFHHLMAFRSSWLPMTSSSNILAITHSGPANFIEFGRIMQKFWLQATNEGLSVQPLGAMPLLLSRIVLSNGLGLNQKEIFKLSSLKNRFLQITPNFNNESDQLVMLFRVGYSKKKPIKSYRKPLETFLI